MIANISNETPDTSWQAGYISAHQLSESSSNTSQLDTDPAHSNKNQEKHNAVKYNIERLTHILRQTAPVPQTKLT